VLSSGAFSSLLAISLFYASLTPFAPSYIIKPQNWVSNSITLFRCVHNHNYIILCGDVFALQ